MLIVHVEVHVKENKVNDFLQATLKNAEHSLKEPGVARFDVLQNQKDPTCFLLNEVYLTDDDPARHKETEHYKIWREAVEDMMERPRSSVRYTNCYPPEVP
mgnify:CR=1 FL=1